MEDFPNFRQNQICKRLEGLKDTLISHNAVGKREKSNELETDYLCRSHQNFIKIDIKFIFGYLTQHKKSTRHQTQNCPFNSDFIF